MEEVACFASKEPVLFITWLSGMKKVVGVANALFPNLFDFIELALRSRPFAVYYCLMCSHFFHFVYLHASEIARARRLHLPGRIHECGQ